MISAYIVAFSMVKSSIMRPISLCLISPRLMGSVILFVRVEALVALLVARAGGAEGRVGVATRWGTAALCGVAAGAGVKLFCGAAGFAAGCTGGVAFGVVCLPSRSSRMRCSISSSGDSVGSLSTSVGTCCLLAFCPIETMTPKINMKTQKISIVMSLLRVLHYPCP